ncbi:MAG: hypothetical protein HQL98_14245 [Magnetococcales bacterium]|nr:hypothetical protein [Magnetococcales bacterium]
MNKIFPLLLGALVLTAGCTQYDTPPLRHDQARYENEGRVRGDQPRRDRDTPPPEVRENRANDRAQYKQCVRENKREGQPRRTVELYCECVSDKMPDNERRSLSAWESAHPHVVRECEKRAGWR